MSQRVERASQWIYTGIWAVLVRWFRVPDHPPTLPTAAGETADSFRPAPGFLNYLTFHFWIYLVLFDGAVLIGWIVVTALVWWLGLLLAAPALVVAVAPDIVAYIAIHLRYDTTWYVLTGRSLRIRRGIWVIHETTITFENVQNIRISQGPLQRYFGIANVLVETAGGGTSTDAHGNQIGASHQGLIEGVADAARIRDMILVRLRQTQTTGLGDEMDDGQPVRRFSPAHLAVLREIRDTARQLAETRA